MPKPWRDGRKLTHTNPCDLGCRAATICDTAGVRLVIISFAPKRKIKIARAPTEETP